MPLSHLGLRSTLRVELPEKADPAISAGMRRVSEKRRTLVGELEPDRCRASDPNETLFFFSRVDLIIA
jgi:hypothetical protein